MNYPSSPRRNQGQQRFSGPIRPCDSKSKDSQSAKDTSSSKKTYPPISPTDLPADIVLARLRSRHLRITGSGPWQATCPTHSDTNPSVSLTETEEGVLLVKCWGGCSTEDILEDLGLSLRNLYPSLYALQFSKRRPQGNQRYQGGGSSAEVVEPSDEACDRWKQLLKSYPASRPNLKELAAQLSIPHSALTALNVGYDRSHGCWLFPERDDKRRIVGLVRRYPDGRKRAIEHSVRGLTIPARKELPDGPFYLVEGASDTAALFAQGALVVGRPSALGSMLVNRWLFRLLREHTDRQIIIVADRERRGVGERGAINLAVFLRCALERSVAWAFPAKGFKDLREQIVAGKWKRGLSFNEANHEKLQ